MREMRRWRSWTVEFFVLFWFGFLYVCVWLCVYSFGDFPFEVNDRIKPKPRFSYIVYDQLTTTRGERKSSESETGDSRGVGR